MNYRNTPHSSTGILPASLTMNRHIITKIPRLDLSRSFKARSNSKLQWQFEKVKAKAIHGQKSQGDPLARDESPVRSGAAASEASKQANHNIWSFYHREGGSQRRTCERTGTIVKELIYAQESYSSSARSNEPVSRPTQGWSVPSHGNFTLKNTEHVGTPFREQRVPNYFNDFLLS